MNTVNALTMDATQAQGLRRTEAGTRFMVLLRERRPVAAVVAHDDFLRLAEIERRQAAVDEVLAEHGFPGDLSTEAFVQLIATLTAGVRRGSC